MSERYSTAARVCAVIFLLFLNLFNLFLTFKNEDQEPRLLAGTPDPSSFGLDIVGDKDRRRQTKIAKCGQKWEEDKKI